MALNFECGGIKDWKTVCLTEDGKKWTPKTEWIVFLTMFVGMGVITEKNYTEFYKRARIWSKVIGREDDLTLSDIEAHIGLWTNASSMTKTQFKNKCFEVLWNEAA